MAEPKRASILTTPPDTEAELDAQAEADFAAGRVVPHADVAKWLSSWGTENELPCPAAPKPC